MDGYYGLKKNVNGNATMLSKELKLFWNRSIQWRPAYMKCLSQQTKCALEPKSMFVRQTRHFDLKRPSQINLTVCHH